MKFSYHPVKFDGHSLSGRRNILAFVYDMTLQDHVTRSYLTLWSAALQDKLQPYQVWWPMHCGSGDIMVLNWHVILQDHVIKQSCDFMSRSPLMQVTIQQSLVALATLVLELIPQDHVIKWSFDFMLWSPSR